MTGIGERPKDSLDDDLKRWLTHYEQVGSVVDEGAVAEKVGWLRSKLPVDRLEATVEAHILPAAHVREALSIPGTSTKLPRAGEPTQPVTEGYMANAWIRMRHPDYDQLRRMLDRTGETVKVRAE